MDTRRIVTISTSRNKKQEQKHNRQSPKPMVLVAWGPHPRGEIITLPRSVRELHITSCTRRITPREMRGCMARATTMAQLISKPIMMKVTFAT